MRTAVARDSTANEPWKEGERSQADDGSRTRDLELGKLALYQLSYVRRGVILGAAPG
jgi:hypothetical protein